MSAMPVEKRRATYADYLQTPEGGEYQLVEGSIVRSPSPSATHQSITLALASELRRSAREHGLGTVFIAPFDVYFDDETVLQPDVLFVAAARTEIIERRFVRGAPDIAIEVVSETSAHNDMVLKKRLHARFGVPEYWIVIPEEEAVDVYVLGAGSYDLARPFRNPETTESPAVPGLTADLAQVF